MSKLQTNKIRGKITFKNTLGGNIKSSPIYPNLEDLKVKPSMEEQSFKSKMYGYDNVTVEAIEGDKLTIDPSLTEQSFNGLYTDVKVNKIVGETLVINPSLEEQNYDGLYTYVRANPMQTEELTVTPSMGTQTNEGLFNKVTTNPIEARELSVIPGPVDQVIDDYLFNKVTVKGDENLKAENIKKGVSIFDVLGTFEGEGDPELTASFLSSIDATKGANCTKLPDGLTSIISRAFQGCTNLALKELPDTVTSIGSYAFYQCTKLQLRKLPSNLQSIGNYAFYFCDNFSPNLTEIPDTVTSLGTNAFQNCQYINSLTVSSGVTKIGDWTFYNCKRMTEITLKGNITSIGNQAFNSCEKLAKLILPNVTSVPSLYNKDSLGSSGISAKTGYIYVPDSLVSSFKSTSYWSSYATQIKGISEM